MNTNDDPERIPRLREALTEIAESFKWGDYTEIKRAITALQERARKALEDDNPKV